MVIGNSAKESNLTSLRQLSEACRTQTADEVRAILSKSPANINCTEVLDIGAEVAAAGREDILQVLIDKGLDVKRNVDILGEAAHAGHLACVQLLVDNGASVELIKGTTAYTNHSDVTTFLDSYKSSAHNDGNVTVIGDTSAES